MFNTSSNAKKVAGRWHKRKQRFTAALIAGLKRLAIAVDNAQVENLSGSGGPGSYPVRVDTGNLRGSHFFDVKDDKLAIVGNTAEYAHAIHSGEMKTRSGNLYAVPGRPFLDDAADSVNGVDVVGKELHRMMAV